MEFLLFNYSRTAPGHCCHLQQQSSLQSHDRAGQDPVSEIEECVKGVTLTFNSLLCLALSLSLYKAVTPGLGPFNSATWYKCGTDKKEKKKKTLHYQVRLCQCKRLRAQSHILNARLNWRMLFHLVGATWIFQKQKSILHNLNRIHFTVQRSKWKPRLIKVLFDQFIYTICLIRNTVQLI